MASRRYEFMQRDTAGAPLTGGTITAAGRKVSDGTTATPTVSELGDGWYYIDVDIDERWVYTTDAGAGVTTRDRYNEIRANPSTDYPEDFVPALKALGFQNYRILSVSYTGNPARATSMSIATYPTPADAAADTNRISTMTMTATYDSAGRLTTLQQVG